MFEPVLVTTSTEGLQPLGSAAQRSYELVTGAVRQRLGPEHAAIFAEPVAAEHGGSVDWHAPLRGEALALSELPEDERAALTARLGRLVADIRAEAARLGDSRAAEDQRLAEALLNATEVPDPDMVRALRDAAGALHPVLIHWAWVRDEQRAVRGVLTAMVPRPGGAALAPVQERRSGPWWWLLWLGWLLLALLIAAILWLLIAPCGVPIRALNFCAPPPQQITAALTETRIAADAVAALERELALTARHCQPTVPVLPAPVEEGVEGGAEDGVDEGRAVPAPAPAPVLDEARRAEAERRMEERGGSRGDLNFTLEWSTTDDIDLYVTCPTGATVSYLNRGDCNGVYDLDANVLRAEAISDPVENIVFTDAPNGLYQVRAHLKSERTEGAKQVILHVLRRNGPSQSYEGMLGDGQVEWTTNISISR